MEQNVCHNSASEKQHGKLMHENEHDRIFPMLNCYALYYNTKQFAQPDHVDYRETSQGKILSPEFCRRPKIQRMGSK